MTNSSALFTESDLKVYAAVHQLKKTRVLELSREAKLAKSTVQGALARLAERGLVSRTTSDGVPQIRARSPSNTLRSLEATRKRLNAKHNAQDTLLLNAIRVLKAVPPSKAKRRPSRKNTQ